MQFILEKKFQSKQKVRKSLADSLNLRHKNSLNFNRIKGFLIIYFDFPPPLGVEKSSFSAETFF